MAASELRQAYYSYTGMCSTDAPYTVKNTSSSKCAVECLRRAMISVTRMMITNVPCSFTNHSFTITYQAAVDTRLVIIFTSVSDNDGQQLVS